MYELVTGTYSLEGASYVSFGIRSGDVLFEDVDTDRQAVENLVHVCNREQLDILHLGNVVDDFLAGCRY